MDSSGTSAPVSTTARITSWHAAVFFQIFMVLFYVMLGIWYYVVSASPRSISEYAPAESPANFATIGVAFVFALVWLAVLYLTWRGKRLGLLAGTVWGLFNLVTVILGFITGAFTAPDFSDFLFFPVIISGIVICTIAWRTLR